MSDNISSQTKARGNTFNDLNSFGMLPEYKKGYMVVTKISTSPEDGKIYVREQTANAVIGNDVYIRFTNGFVGKFKIVSYSLFKNPSMISVFIVCPYKKDGTLCSEDDYQHVMGCSLYKEIRFIEDDD